MATIDTEKLAQQIEDFANTIVELRDALIRKGLPEELADFIIKQSIQGAVQTSAMEAAAKVLRNTTKQDIDILHDTMKGRNHDLSSE